MDDSKTRLVRVKAAARELGVPYPWLRGRVKDPFSGIPVHVVEGYKTPRLIVEEVREWMVTETLR